MISVRNSVGAAVVAMLLAAAAPAHATSFTLDDFTVTLNNTDPGLVVWEQDLLTQPYTFVLGNVGDTSPAINLFRLGTNEMTVNMDDVVPHPITVDFSFSSPLPGFGGNAVGLTGGWMWNGDVGYVAWNNPYELAFGSTGLLGISLSNAVFDTPGYANITAQFTLLQADSGAAAIPEPASIVLLGSGLAGAALRARRRRIA